MATNKLKFIRKTRPKLKKGDIFYYNINQQFYFGLVISTRFYPDFSDNSAINLLLPNYATADLKDFCLEHFQQSLSPENLIASPAIVNRKPWTQGYFIQYAHMNLDNLSLLAQCRFEYSPSVYNLDYIKVNDIPDNRLLGTVGIYAYEGIEYLIQLGLGLDFDNNERPYKYYKYELLQDKIKGELPYWYYRSIGINDNK